MADLFEVLVIGSSIVLCLILAHRFLEELGLVQSLSILFGGIKPLLGRGSKALKERFDIIHPDLRLFLKLTILTVASRMLIYLLGYLGTMLISNQVPGLVDSFPSLWNRWDSKHYLFIAEHWYVTVTDKKYLIVFFPLYSMAIQMVSWVIGDLFWSGIIVSNLCLAISCFYLYKLTASDFDETVAFRSVKYLLLFPVSFFLGAVFSDGMFLMFSLLTVYQLRRRDWLKAGVWGMLAAFTRNFGLLLLIPALIEWILSHRKQFAKLMDWNRRGLFLFLIPMGYFAYLVLNKSITGDWFTFLTYQKEYWNHNLQLFADLGEYARNASAVSSWGPSDRISIWIPQVALVLTTLMSIIAGLWFRIRYSYLAYMFAYLLSCLSITWLISGPRYMLGLFPLYIVLGVISHNKWFDLALTMLSTLFLAFYTLAFTGGFRIM
jgi:hypothetical protein